ncbi:divergent polysaccharide deacetylase family protein [Candidatus Sumerlaeota bacterium]|nr:divergent polysaccharide deacetylase family protein [Candidatus Sumerlaeota bacterium]
MNHIQEKVLSKIPYFLLLAIYLFWIVPAAFSQNLSQTTYDLNDPADYKFQPFLKDVSFQTVFDVEDPCFEIFSGDWILSKDGSHNASFYYYIAGPGAGSGKARWIAEGLPQGDYLIEFYVNNDDYAQDARYQVIDANGVHELTVNMRYLADGWHTLGTFSINRYCVVNISDYWTLAGTKIMVDALRFTLQTTLPAPPSTSIPPHIGICIDDCGSVNPLSSSTPIYKMLRLPLTMTYAVIPCLSYTSASANEIVNWGSEVILHQPMAAISVPDPGACGITDAMTLEQVRTMVANNLTDLPHVIGMNNHMGSLITQQQDKMQVCVEELQKKDCFFYDSRTITTAVAYDVAMNNGILTAERDFFIDGSNKETSKALIRNLALRALYAPYVPQLAIGHVRSATADSLTEMAVELATMGVEVWPISKCVTQVVEADYQPSGASFSTQGSWTNNSADRFSKELKDDHCVIVNDPASSYNEKAIFTPNLPVSGKYDIFTTWEPRDDLTSQGQVIITHAYGTDTQTLDQSLPFYDWVYLGRYSMQSGTGGKVELNDYACTVPGKVFCADAVKFVYIEPLGTSSCTMWKLY